MSNEKKRDIGIISAIILIFYIIWSIVSSGYFESDEFHNSVESFREFNPGGKKDLDAFVDKFLK